MISQAQHFRLTWLIMAALWLGGMRIGAAGEPDDYLFDVWNSENGLPDSSVTAIAQTPDGYLWVGTYNGVARFDGVHFETFDPANTPALTHARVRRLSVDNRGVLWISTYDGSLTRYQDGVFTLERRNTRSSEADVAFVSSSAGELFFLTSRGELLRKPANSAPDEGWEMFSAPARGIGAICCQDGAGTVWYRDGDRHLWRLKGNAFESLPDAAGLAGQNINCLATDSKGRLWVGTDHALATWDGTVFRPAVPAPANASLDVECLAISGGSHVWAVANGCVCEWFDGNWTLKPDSTRNIFAGATSRIGAQEDHHGGMWFYNYGRGLWHVGPGGQTSQLGAAAGFPGERIYCFMEDREGDWWAGLDATGLVRIRPRQFHVLSALENDRPAAARTVCEDAAGRVWLGRLSDGLGCWEKGAFTNFPLSENTAANSVFCVCPGTGDRIWISSGDEDLYLRENGETKRVTPLIHGVKALLADRAGRVWAGTTSGLMVSKNGTPKEFQTFKGLPRHTVRALAEDPAGNLWGGTGNGELFCVTSNDTVTLYPPGTNQESGAIWSVLVDRDDTKWVGTFRGGLLRFQDGKFTRFSKSEGLPDNVICQILDDGRGNLWLGTHQGISRVAKSALNQPAGADNRFVPCVTYGRSAGVPSLECSGGYQPAAWRDHAGQLWFTTAKGVTWIRPEEIKLNSEPPPVVIEKILVDGQAQNLPPPGTALEIPPGKHQIEIRYTGISLAAPDRVQFRYQLASLDRSWIQAGTQRSAVYGYLSPGNYRFQVLACNSDGVWNETGRTLALHIRPHYYETWWFQTLAVLLVLGTVAGVVRRLAARRWRVKMEQLERRQAIERERARIAKDIHDDLGANLTLIAVLGDLAKKDKTGERIEKMSATAREAVKSLDEIVWAVNPRNDTLSHLIDYMGQFATDYLRDAGVRCLLDVPDQTPVREVPANVRHNVFLVVKEGLQNIVKHAHATEVWLRINAGAHDLNVSIEDNGCGFEGQPQDAWADGLRNMRQRLAEVGGVCTITSRVKVGTTISLQLPLWSGGPGKPAHED